MKTDATDIWADHRRIGHATRRLELPTSLDPMHFAQLCRPDAAPYRQSGLSLRCCQDHRRCRDTDGSQS